MFMSNVIDGVEERLFEALYPSDGLINVFSGQFKPNTLALEVDVTGLIQLKGKELLIRSARAFQEGPISVAVHVGDNSFCYDGWAEIVGNTNGSKLVKILIDDSVYPLRKALIAGGHV